MTQFLHTQEPFGMVGISLIENPNVSDRSVRIYALLAAMTLGRSVPVTITQTDIAAKIGASVSSVHRSLRELADEEYISIIHQYRGKEPLANLYQINTRPQAVHASPVAPLLSPVTIPPVTGDYTLLSPVTDPSFNSINNNNIRETTEESPKPARKKREPDILWETLASECNIDWKRATRTELGPLNRAAKELRGVSATPTDVQRAAKAYRKEWPDMTLTPSALLKHWSRFTTPAPTSSPPRVSNPFPTDNPEWVARVWAEYRAGRGWQDAEGWYKSGSPADYGVPETSTIHGEAPRIAQEAP